MENASHVDERPILVVVVDDDILQRTVIRKSLEQDGVVVEEAVHGVHGLERIRALKPDLVVLDALMPEMDGFMVCNELQKDDETKNIPVLMLTSLDDSESIERAFDAGASNFMAKPINCVLLRHVIKYMLRAGKTEANLRLAKWDAEAANIAKSEFLANVSHELRTPLNAIIGFSDIMCGEVLGPIENPQYRGYVDDIRSSGLHLLEVVTDILDISNVEIGRFDLHRDYFCLSETIAEVMRLMSQRAADAGIVVRSQIDPEIPALFSDRHRFKQVLLNLLSNAVKFTLKDGRVTVRADMFRDLVITISDTGIGIPPAKINKALSPFGQVDSSLNRKYEGVGLGLPLAKSITELLGGSLTIRSQSGEGTTVTLAFLKDTILAADATNAPQLAD